MAKSTAKTPAKTPVKKTVKKTTTTASESDSAVAESNSIVTTSETILKKLKDLGIDNQLQADLEWCLGSYKADNNPAGLYEMAKRALVVFKDNKSTKGVTAKLISDLEKAVQ